MSNNLNVFHSVKAILMEITTLGTVITNYEVSFTRYFYKPQPLRTLEEIRVDILALEKETEGLLTEIVGKSGQ